MNAAAACDHIEQLLAFALRRGLITPADVIYSRNQLLAALNLTQPSAPMDAEDRPAEMLPPTATPMLDALCDFAAQQGLIGDLPEERELLDTKLMGLLTPRPGEVERVFAQLEANAGAAAATRWFYGLCRASNYIRVDAIARNVRYFERTSAGELEITINLSKPEKDPRSIAAALRAPKSGYPTCMLCRENVGYQGRIGFPARQTHRTLQLTLNGEPWHLQYSPYLYYEEHCIVFSHDHTPMKATPAVFERLLDFVARFPHYFLGANAPLPIVGGSILSHDHFQGGQYAFPMDRAPIRAEYAARGAGDVCVQIVEWPMPCLRVSGPRAGVAEVAKRTMAAWSAYSDAARGILSHTDGTAHNAVTPIARRTDDGYRLDLVLRNNRTTPEHPMGLFHPHTPLHHIKKENIGLIEVMGCFILPGRLQSELAAAAQALRAGSVHNEYPAGHPLQLHAAWLRDVAARHGRPADEAAAQKILRAEVAEVCAQVLRDAGVFAQTEDGRAGLMQFVKAAGIADIT